MPEPVFASGSLGLGSGLSRRWQRGCNGCDGGDDDGDNRASEYHCISSPEVTTAVATVATSEKLSKSGWESRWRRMRPRGLQHTTTATITSGSGRGGGGGGFHHYCCCCSPRRLRRVFSARELRGRVVHRSGGIGGVSRYS